MTALLVKGVNVRSVVKEPNSEKEHYSKVTCGAFITYENSECYPWDLV